MKCAGCLRRMRPDCARWARIDATTGYPAGSGINAGWESLAFSLLVIRCESALITLRYPHRTMDNSLIGGPAEPRRAEEALRESQALYHALVEQMPAGVFRKDAEGRYVFVNSWFCRLKGVKAELFLGRKPSEVAAVELTAAGAHPSQINQLATQGMDHHQQIMQTGRQIEVEEHGLGPDGKDQYLHVVK